MSKMDAVIPVKLSIDSKFKFRCHKGIKCFTKCCNSIDILLTPYDILRMKKRLGLTSGEFLSVYTNLRIDEKSTLPQVILQMNNDEAMTCPFVTSDGCKIYEDRPANCRYYPIGQATLRKEGEKGPENEEFYFFIKEPHCYGYDENKGWTVESWRIDQEVDLYDEMNREWKATQLRKVSPGHPALDAKQQNQIYLASYDLDSFRRFIFESRFLDIFDLGNDLIEKIKTDEVELMKFGFEYIKYIMLIEQTLKPQKGVIKEGRERERLS
ncbi:MAG: YkgJ family cysteine cluster protein [Nitrospirae bacterium]|nr:YkgJ family cysteine cluster protein [Nitrospirota bacterium]